MGKFLSNFNRKLLVTDKKNYSREQLQSFMTTPEWRNVEMAEEFADFVKKGNSIFYFPYFSQVKDLWRLVGQAYKAARTYNSHSEIWFKTDYMIMDLFIAFFTTLELIPKGIVAFFLRPFVSKENHTPMQNELGNYFERYAKKLHTVPFYDHPYEEERKILRAAYNNIPNKTWTDRLSWALISIDLFARKWISKPLHFWFHQETNLVAATTDVLVKYNAENTDNPENAKQEFLNQLQKAQKSAKAQADIVNQEVYAKEKNPAKSYTSIYARLRVPRYDDFKPTEKALSDNNIHIRKIAGHDRVQVKCVVEADSIDNVSSIEQNLQSIPNTNLLYSYVDRIHNNKKTLMFDVPVKNLQETVDDLNETDGASVKFIHNF